ncbi:1,3-beta-D-glucan synthase [Chytridiales sp. JEL 0842]|nr:1,3-beta-D-glucan synthase [Chytridiales sp. JEL 0842]
MESTHLASPEPASSNSLSSFEDSVDTAVIPPASTLFKPHTFGINNLKSAANAALLAGALHHGSPDSNHASSATAGSTSDSSATTVPNIDLLLAWRRLQHDSRYAFTAPSPQAIISYIANLRGVPEEQLAPPTPSSSASKVIPAHRIDLAIAADGDACKVEGLLAAPNYGPASSPSGFQMSGGSVGGQQGSSSSRHHHAPLGMSNMEGMPDNIAAESSSSQSSDQGSGRFPPQRATFQGVSFDYVELTTIFEDLRTKFGFQLDAVRNTQESMKCMLDSRTSRMPPEKALKTLFDDYIAGESSNFRKWLTLVNLVPASPQQEANVNEEADPKNWLSKEPSPTEQARLVALYLLIWTEASNIRLIPEALCFIFFLAMDYYSTAGDIRLASGTFLFETITPLYQFLRDQNWKVIDGKLVQKEKDHAHVIGYDDINEFFWSRERVASISLKETRQKLWDLPPPERYRQLRSVDWKATFRKTFKEKRSVLHMISNFSRIWILHLGFFVSYIAWVAGPVYAPEIEIMTAAASGYTVIAPTPGFSYITTSSSPSGIDPFDSFGSASTDMDPVRSAALGQFDDRGATTLRWALTGLGGVFAALFAIVSTLIEASFLPVTTKTFKIFGRRLFIFFLLFLLNLPCVTYVVLINKRNTIAKICSGLQMAISLSTIAYLVITPPSKIAWVNNNGKKEGLSSESFTASYAPLKPTERWLSVGIWALVIVSKLAESLFFLIMPIGKPLKMLLTLPLTDCGKGLLFCRVTLYSTVALMLITVLVLFFLDTYMWWIVWSTVLGVIRALFTGLSILTPWRNIFARLPERMSTKLFAANQMTIKQRPKVMCAQLWNSVVIAMAQDHLLSLENLDKLIYRQHAIDGEPNRTRIERPKFFTSQEDVSTKMEFFPAGSEAERRITFFAQSLSMIFPEPTTVQKMPAFSILVPHYGEKILLSLREVIKDRDSASNVTLLEYLKSLHPFEWENFVKDTRIATGLPLINTDELHGNNVAIEAFGFKDPSPEGTLRTRIWASLRSQTLFRTVSGFMNYEKALKLLLRIETPQLVSAYEDNPDLLDRELTNRVAEKFTFVVAMQRYASFNREEVENVELLMRIYPGLKISYLEEVSDDEQDEKMYFVNLIDGTCPMNANGKRTPIFRVQLPGPPILGDGKADNQNTSIIWTRGEYIQLVDANQDNYFEEAIKIRSILAEFEPQASSANGSNSPVAIVGAREYIFSEKIGVLGDVAAGKEYTFGTIAQRVTAKLGGRLHYGHPDFLNSIFMYTRGGVSKAQKGLSVNEDIFAGMNTLQRGGRIKHTEYMQCGKGRDLGFSSILKFVAKIGAGMGEQILSREHYYLGSQLPLDRLLTFYYGHPGFHINNVFIMFSLQLMMLFMVGLTALRLALTPCLPRTIYDNPYLPPTPEGCADIESVVEWVKQAVFSIVAVFAVTFLPLFLQILTEQGLIASIGRILKHVFCLSPLFDVFTTQIYAYTLLYDLNFGRAGYIASGRGFATARNPFHQLYTAFAEPSIYLGMRLFLILASVTIIMGFGHLAFFWFMILPLFQFKLDEFVLDYRRLLNWFSAGNTEYVEESWISYHTKARAQITGHKRKSGEGSAQKGLFRPKFTVIILQEVIIPLILAALGVSAFGVIGKSLKSAIMIAGASLAPVILNLVFLLVLFPISVFFGPCLSACDRGCFGSTMAGMAHGWAVLTSIICYVIVAVLGDKNLGVTLLGIFVVATVQRAVFRIMTVFFLTREHLHGGANIAWWNGRWLSAGFGWTAIFQPGRELICKVMEMSAFAADFALCHWILFMFFPLCLFPFIDEIHTFMLLWTNPKSTELTSRKKFSSATESQRSTRFSCCGRQPRSSAVGERASRAKRNRGPVLSARQRRERGRTLCGFGTLFVFMLLFFVGLVAVPAMMGIPGMESKKIMKMIPF